ncbi:MAG TPA: TetR family transcriptional regulator [Cellulomonas sp.]
MVRWEPGARERLQQAALVLFAERGFEQTTAADIARSVGLTERTFFRHFADKREVLFDGQHLLAEAFRTGFEAAPAGAAPLDVVVSALRSAADFFPDARRPYSRARQTVIDQNPALQERERHKMAELAALGHEVLLGRGIADPAATLAAETGITVFSVAFAQWIRHGENRSFAQIQTAVLDELRSLTGSESVPVHQS